MSLNCPRRLELLGVFEFLLEQSSNFHNFKLDRYNEISLFQTFKNEHFLGFYVDELNCKLYVNKPLAYRRVCTLPGSSLIVPMTPVVHWKLLAKIDIPSARLK